MFEGQQGICTNIGQQELNPHLWAWGITCSQPRERQGSKQW